MGAIDYTAGHVGAGGVTPAQLASAVQGVKDFPRTVDNSAGVIDIDRDTDNFGEIHISASNNITINASNWQDGDYFTILNSSGTELNSTLLFTGFSNAILRDGDNTDVSSGLLLGRKDSWFLIRVDETGGDKNINIYPSYTSTLIPFISDVCLFDSNGNQITSIETIDVLEGNTYTLRFNAQFASNFTSTPTLVARRGTVLENIGNISNINNGINNISITFSETDIINLNAGTGALRLNFVSGALELEATCIAIEPLHKSVQLTGSTQLTSQADYNDLPNKTGYTPYELVNGAFVEVTAQNTVLTLYTSLVPVDITIAIKNTNISFASSGITISGVEFPSNGDILQIKSIGNTFYIIKIN